MASRPVTRKLTETWLIGHPSASIAGAKLPNCRQAMQYFFYLRNDPVNIKNKTSNEELAYTVIDAVVVFWQMARIKIKTRQNSMLQFMSLWTEWHGLAKNKARSTDPGGKRAAFMLKLGGLFDISAADAVDEIMKSRLLTAQKKQDDINFLFDQRNERKAVMDGHDKVFETKAEMQAARLRRSQDQLMPEADAGTSGASDMVALEGESDIESQDAQSVDDNEEDVDRDFQSHTCNTRTDFVNLNLPKKIMQCEEITAAADRLKLSDIQITMIISAIVKAGNSDLNNFDVSRSTTRRNRMANRQKIADDIIATVRQNPPRFGALHWDGKLLSDLLGESKERLAVLVSGAPEYSEGKLLGVPTLLDSTGKSQANASYDLLDVWELTDNVVALVFDTTASNSGIHKGAATLLEQRLEKKLFYLACRHHVLELVVGAVWKLLFGKALGPDNQLFAGFKSAWNSLNKQTPVNTVIIDHPWLSEVRTHVTLELTNILTHSDSNTFPRDDYRECAENTLVILGETPPRGVHFMKPGAIHHARWMACNIYAGKMFMFHHQMSYDDEMIVKLKRVNMFLSMFYTSAWMKASIGADAPINDLQLFQDMFAYLDVDHEVAEEVLRKLENHCWYLTEEIVPFALFSKLPVMTNKLKQDIASKLLATPVPDCFRLGKPLFRKIDRDTTLIDLIGPESHTLFHTLNINTGWLAKPVEDWSFDPDFQIAENFVHSVKVVNDAAERGVKLISDFATIITTDPAQRQALLQGVENHRQMYPDFKKTTLSN